MAAGTPLLAAKRLALRRVAPQGTWWVLQARVNVPLSVKSSCKDAAPQWEHCDTPRNGARLTTRPRWVSRHLFSRERIVVMTESRGFVDAVVPVVRGRA